ncbi:C40 family peptidase [Streptomyces ficellus]|uniref:C40 family peptidase n=1 Tax=Streptomyces ficellus TaxID=1977088 RepID=A0ABT7ZB27_9ACTN|nr:C40 family peptidase [Streptomyces ficellus]MDN3296713.1 C40 family peptidase [Streptomyces ficellus]
MPALASHRKPRTRTMQTLQAHSPAVGVTTAAALASVTLLSSQSATAAPGDPDRTPTVEEVQRKVDDLYRQAGTATRQYNKAPQATGEQRRGAGALPDDAARRTEALNDSRRALGTHAAAPYRSGAMSPTAALAFADSPPQSFADQAMPMDRLTDRPHQALTDHQTRQARAAERRAEATWSPESLTASQASLRATKQTVQRKLAEARALLAHLTAEERERLAELERERAEEARRRAEEKAKTEAEEAHARHRQQQQQQHGQQDRQEQPPRDDRGYTPEAAKVLAFAEAQIGKPYVWGATGPSSYDCSGLTQAAWRAAGVDLPRTTRDQAKAGPRVATEDLRPGDLVFFCDEISHVGIYKGDGKMIHAPNPGANVREESVHSMPIHSGVRPA